MPRGYRKQQPGTSRKTARGSSSHRHNKDTWVEKKSKKGAKNKFTATDICQDELDMEYSTCFREDYDDKHDVMSSWLIMDHGDDHEEEDNTIKATAKNSIRKLTKCAICLEEKFVVQLFKNCKHDSACQDCLRELYLYHAPSDVSQYPLKCFHPDCNLVLQTHQLTQCLGVPEGSPAMIRHRRLSVLAKAYHQYGQMVVHCPNCDFPRRITEQIATEDDDFAGTFTIRDANCRCCRQQFGWRQCRPNLIFSLEDTDTRVSCPNCRKCSQRVFLGNFLGEPEDWFGTVDCKGCSKRFGWRFGRPDRVYDRFQLLEEQRALQRDRQLKRVAAAKKNIINEHKQTVQAISALPFDEKGRNNGWTLCPFCSIIISKGNGCNHVRCVCGKSFNWVAAGGGHIGI